MYVQIRLFNCDDQKSVKIDCKSINESVIDLRSKVAEKFCVPPGSKIRMFFDGKELKDGYTLYEYGVKLNMVIQVLLSNIVDSKTSASSSKTAETCYNTSQDVLKDVLMSQQKSQDLEKQDLIEAEMIEDNYYRVNEFVDALHPDVGAWFEGKITKISKIFASTESVYHVKFDKTSFLEIIPLKLNCIRPQSRRKLSLREIRVGEFVLVNFNLNEEMDRGFWYEFLVSRKDEKRKLLFGNIFVGGETLLKDQKIKFVNEVYAIETNVPMKERSQQITDIVTHVSKVKRITAADCSKCDDDLNAICKECSCCVCGSKDSPDKQLFCDECDKIFHIWCLPEPLNELPPDEEDWYCTRCKNNDRQIIEKEQKDQLLIKKTTVNRVGTGEWGRGMACVGRSKIADIGKDHFGPIPGVKVGTCWRFRFQASEAGVHTPLVAGICGKENKGATSIVFCCAYVDDIDLGDEIFYTGAGGRDSEGKSRVGGPQTKDQELKRCNKALAMNCYAPFNCTSGGNSGLNWKLGKPVRVLRSGNARGSAKKSLYLPKIGVRYDGIYKVVKYWPQKSETGFIVWRYVLRRDDEEPSPWTKEGKNRMRNAGLTIINPPGWSEKPKVRKRKSKPESNDTQTKRHDNKILPFLLPNDVKSLIEKDIKNVALWNQLQSYCMLGKNEFFGKVEEIFKCVCCLDMLTEPITTICKHNICKNCLERSIAAGTNSCPICRSSLPKKQKSNFKVNSVLQTVLEKFNLMVKP